MENYQNAKKIERNKAHYLIGLKELSMRIPVTNQKERSYFPRLHAAAQAG